VSGVAARQVANERISIPERREFLLSARNVHGPAAEVNRDE